VLIGKRQAHDLEPALLDQLVDLGGRLGLRVVHRPWRSTKLPARPGVDDMESSGAEG